MIRDLEILGDQLETAACRVAFGSTPSHRSRARIRTRRGALLAFACTIAVVVPATAAVSGIWNLLDGPTRSSFDPALPAVTATTREPDEALRRVLAPLRHPQKVQDQGFLAKQAITLQGLPASWPGRGSIELAGVRRLRSQMDGLQFFLIPVHPDSGSAVRDGGGDVVNVQAVNAVGEPPTGLSSPPAMNAITAASLRRDGAFFTGERFSDGSRSVQVAGLLPDNVARVRLVLSAGRDGSHPTTLVVPVIDNLLVARLPKLVPAATTTPILDPHQFVWYASDGHIIPH